MKDREENRKEDAAKWQRGDYRPIGISKGFSSLFGAPTRARFTRGEKSRQKIRIASASGTSLKIPADKEEAQGEARN